MSRSRRYSAPRPRTPSFVLDSIHKLLSTSSRGDSSGSAAPSKQKSENDIGAENMSRQSPHSVEEACVLNNTIILIESPAELAVPGQVKLTGETEAANSDSNSVKIDVSEETNEQVQGTSGSGESTTAGASGSVHESNEQVKDDTKIDVPGLTNSNSLDVVQVELRVYWIALLNIVFLVLSLCHANNWKINPSDLPLIAPASDITTTIGARIAFAALLHMTSSCTFFLYIVTWLAGLALIHRGEPLPNNSEFGNDQGDERINDFRPRLLTIATMGGCVGALLIIAAAAIAPTNQAHLILLGISLVFQFMWGVAYLIAMANVAANTRIGKCIVVIMWLGLATSFYGAIGVWFFIKMQNMFAVSISTVCIVVGLITMVLGVTWLNFRENVTISCK